MQEKAEQNSEPKKWYQCHYRIIGVALCIMLLLLMIGNYMIYSLIDKEKINSTEIISSILTASSKEKSLIPDIIILSRSDSSRVKLDSTLKKDLIKFLTNKYTSNNSDSEKVFDIKPYLSSTDIKDEDKIARHIEFLVSTVKMAVEESKHNIDTEISKINTWVVIWIGTIGFLGIFFPLMINLKSLDELKNIKFKAKAAKKIADGAKNTLDSYKTQLESLPTLETKVNGFDEKIQLQETRIGALNTQYATIETAATNAETKSTNTEKLLYTLNMVFKLKDIDGVFLMYNKEPLKTLVKYFEEIHKELSEKSIDFKHPFIFDALRQLALRLYILAPYPFVLKEIQPKFYILSELISKKLETGITEDSFKEILNKFNSLIDSLKS
jgi:hypothetical protein